MSDVVEKSDVDISKLFNWGRVFEIVNPTDEEEITLVYMKLLGDADLGIARVHALRKSAELRRKLMDEDSDERLAWIRPFNEVEVADLINLITIFSAREISNTARGKLDIKSPKPPKSNAKLEQMEKFQKEVDDYPGRKAKAMSEAIEKEVSNLREQLATRTKEELYKEYVRLLINEFCEREAIQAFDNMQTYLGCYADDTYKPDKRLFKDFDEFDNLEPTIKTQFKDAYRSIDIELGELKKLRRATP